MKKSNLSIQKNEIYEMTITALSSDGNGIGRVNDIVVFVPNTAVGDIVRVKIVKALKSYAFGRVEKILSPSCDRIENNCGVFEKCGGCAYRHINYEAETKQKAEQVFRNVKTIGKTDFVEGDILCNTDKTERYRNKGQYPLGIDQNGEIVCGFYAPRSHRIIPIEDCKLQPKVFSKIISEVKGFLSEKQISIYDESTKKGLFRHIYLREAAESGEIMVCFVVKGNDFTDKTELCECLTNKFPQIKSIILNVNMADSNVILGEKCITLWGNGIISDKICGIDVKLSPLSFYQVNHDMAERVYRLAADLAELKKDDTLLDLYCGAGLIGLSCADKVKNVVGIEVVPEAIENAKENARNNSIDNAQFFCGDASLIAQLLEKGYKFDVAIVDPPRKGCSSDVLEALSKSGAKKIVYVSCNSSTLARDINELSQKGYKAKIVVPADLFPRTIHCEAVALLQKVNNVHNMKLHSLPFEKIKSGEKTIELRLYDEKRRQIKVGDKIVFTNTATNETLAATVIKLHCFDSFEQLYENLPILKCGYTINDIDTASASDMLEYYPGEEQAKYGVVGIELSLD